MIESKIYGLPKELPKLDKTSSESSANVRCSFCDSDDVKKISAFGTAQLVKQFYCHSCHSVFEVVRW